MIPTGPGCAEFSNTCGTSNVVAGAEVCDRGSMSTPPRLSTLQRRRAMRAFLEELATTYGEVARLVLRRGLGLSVVFRPEDRAPAAQRLYTNAAACAAAALELSK